MRLLSLLAVLSISATPALGYGILGHTLTGQVAQIFLTPDTASQVKTILSPYYDGLLSKCAPWPDTIKGQAKYRWASIFHYVNTPGDDPPNHCAFEYDFNGHDVVNGLYNMTSTLYHFKLHPPTTLEDKSTREDALRFFVHFMGDIHQPLHTSGKLRGGNDAPAKWLNAKSNLHRIWDSQLLLKDIKDRFENNPKAYLDNTIELTKTVWQPEASKWSVCDPTTKRPENPWQETSSLLTTLCPTDWAKTMNEMACDVVWKDYDALEDHSKAYFENVTGEKSDYLVQKLLAMSGIRMAAILNEIYDPLSVLPDALSSLGFSPDRHWSTSTTTTVVGHVEQEAQEEKEVVFGNVVIDQQEQVSKGDDVTEGRRISFESLPDSWKFGLQ